MISDIPHGIMLLQTCYIIIKLPVNKCSFFLSNPVNPSDSLELLCWVQQRLHQNDMTRLYQIESVGSLADWHQ